MRNCTDLMKKFRNLKESSCKYKPCQKRLKPCNLHMALGTGKPDIPFLLRSMVYAASVVSAVDLIKGIGIASGMKSVSVEGATEILKPILKVKPKLR